MNLFKICQEEKYTPEVVIENSRIYDIFKKQIEDNKISWKVSNQWTTYRDNNTTAYLMVLYGTIKSDYIGNKVPSYAVTIKLNALPSTPFQYLSKSRVTLYLNKQMTSTFHMENVISSWVFSDNSGLSEWLESNINVNVKMPHIINQDKEALEKLRLTKAVRLTRAKRSNRGLVATALEIFIEPKKKEGHVVSYRITDLENNRQGQMYRIQDKSIDGGELTSEEALDIMNKHIEGAKANYYVDESSLEYIPRDATSDNFDFVLNRRKNLMDKNVSPEDINIDELLASNMRQYRVAQNFGGYYTGNVPDYATQFLGTSAVEDSQIKSMFGRAHEAVDLVNQFDSSLLSNISFIFNFAKSGAYGVYLSELDRSIKTKALQKKLEQKGYEVKITNQGITAFPKKDANISSEEIQRDIDMIYADLEQKGGTAIGINMNAVLNAARQDALQSGSEDSNIWEWIAVLHLGGTIVHEAVHAKGHADEGPSEQAEQSFTQWALSKVNEAYKKNLQSQGREDEFVPLIVTGQKRYAKNQSWYKTAQLSYYLPHQFVQQPTGSDLGGRFPMGTQADYGMGSWSMMAQQGQDMPIELRLGRQYMSRVPKDLSQEHDSIEEQLRKYTRDDRKLDAHATMEELLSEGWDEDRGYTIMEGLLDEKRPKPLMVPLKKNASNMTKTATLFGWMNNLEISDGSTIPGLGDRVMAWDDRDEDFSAEEDWIKKQPRYNPTYDIKGFYYRWIEPRFQPQLFDDMTRDYSNTHPAKRFASSLQVESELIEIMKILSKAKHNIKNGQINSTRFVITEDVMPIFDKMFSEDIFKMCVFHYGVTDKKEDILAVWVSSANVDAEIIEKAERHIQNKLLEKEDIEKIMDDLTGISTQRSSTIENIIDIAKDTCKSHNICKMFIVGSYPIDKVTKVPTYLIDNIEFRGELDQCLKIGSLVAEKLGAYYVNISHNRLSFIYKNVKVVFSNDFIPKEIENMIEKEGLSLLDKHSDLYNRDFTINMLSYDLFNNKIIDFTGNAAKDINDKNIRTFFDADIVCSKNPIIILRALKAKIRYNMDIDESLQNAMNKYSSLVFDGRYSDIELIIARENVKKEGKKEALALFEKFGLENIEKVN